MVESDPDPMGEGPHIESSSETYLEETTDAPPSGLEDDGRGYGPTSSESTGNGYGLEEEIQALKDGELGDERFLTEDTSRI